MKKLFCIISACFLLVGCGQYGSLYLPANKLKEHANKKPVNTSVRSYTTQAAPL